MRQWSDAAFRFAHEVSARWGAGVPFRAGRLSGTHLRPAEPPFPELDRALCPGGTGSDFRIITVAADAARSALPSPRLSDGDPGRLLRLEGPGPAVEWVIGARGDMIGLDPVRRNAVHFTTVPLHPADHAAPLRNELVWLAALQSACVMHAAAIGVQGRGVLVLGRGGVGKSTLTVCALAAGLDACGDDYVWVEPTADGYAAHRLYRSVKLDPDGPGHQALGSPMPYRSFAADGARAGYLLDDAGPLNLTAQLQIEALVLLDPTQTVGTPRVASAREVLLAAGISTISQQHQSQRHALRFITELGRSLPGFALPARNDPGWMVEQIATLLNRAT